MDSFHRAWRFSAEQGELRQKGHHFPNGQDIAVNLKAYIQPGKGDAIHSLRILLIGGTWILAKNFQKRLAMLRRHERKEVFREYHFQGMCEYRLGKAGSCLGMAIGERKIGLDIEDRGAVDQICANTCNTGPNWG